MMRGMFAAISGLQVHQSMLDVAANDIANVNTIGFKGEQTSFKDALSQLVRGPGAPSTAAGGTNAVQVGLGVQLGAIQNQMGAGAIQQTGNPYDLVVSGDGFFKIGTSASIAGTAPYSYTRAGNFTLDSSGTLVTQDGQFVVGPAWAGAAYTGAVGKITLPAGGTSLTVSPDGSVTYVDNTGTVQNLAQIQLAIFPNMNGLKRVSGNAFQETSNSGVESVGVAGTTGYGALQAGAVEMSNVDLAREFTTMITAQRGYEANSRIISMADQMLQNLVNIGR